MLVLSREEDQSIIIGENIEICVVRIDGNSVRLGISAPREITVHRKEVYDAIKATNQQAATTSHDTKDKPNSLAQVAKRMLSKGEKSNKAQKS